MFNIKLRRNYKNLKEFMITAYKRQIKLTIFSIKYFINIQYKLIDFSAKGHI